MSKPFIRKLNPFKPTDIGGCALWLDGADSSSIILATGSNISTWIDKSSLANNFSNSSGTFSTKTTTPGGYPSIFVNGGQMTSISNNATTGNSSRSIFMITQTVGGVSRFGTGSHSGATPPNTYGYDLNVGLGTLWCPYVYNASDITFSSPNSNMYCLFSDYNSATSTLRGIVNFTLTASNSTTLNTTATPWYLGLRPDGFGSVSAYVCEIIQYNIILTTAQRQQLEGYLAQKWGLQANLPAGSPGRTGVIYPRTLLIDSLTTGQPTRLPFIRPRATLQTRTFTYTGSLQSFVVPATTSSITVYMWGAGGGGYFPTQSYGGAGCYLTGILSVTASETLSVLVGQAGTIQFPAQTGVATRFGGGGGIISTGGNGNAQYNGSGGGRSAIQRSGTDIVSAGAGGGCGTQAGSGNGHNGGTGSWTGTGGNGADDKFGLGGTQTAGGASQGNGAAGTALVGGRADPWGGGGGGGFYGGGAGSDNNSFGSGGGGGSSYTDLLSSKSGSNGTLNVAPATNSPYYVSGVAVGGTQALSGNGGPGLVVITYYS